MKNYTFILSLILLCLVAYPEQAFGQTGKYTVIANTSESITDKQKSYFDLKMEPAETKELSLRLINNSDDVLTLTIETNAAITNNNGVIDYSTSAKEKQTDPSLKIDFNAIITGPKEITLNGKETQTVVFTLTLPKKQFDGLLLGGFYISEKNTSTSSETSDTAMIKNKLSYAIAVAVTQTDQKISSDLQLNAVQPSLMNYRTAVTATIQNPQPEIVEALNITARIYKQNSTKLLYETTKESMRMAPNSNFDFPISWNDHVLEAGDYRLELLATSANGKWQLSKDFEITAKESKQLNKQAVELKTESNWLEWLVIGLSSALLILILVLVKIKLTTHNSPSRQSKEGTK